MNVIAVDDEAVLTAQIPKEILGQRVRLRLGQRHAVAHGGLSVEHIFIHPVTLLCVGTRLLDVLLEVGLDDL